MSASPLQDQAFETTCPDSLRQALRDELSFQIEWLLVELRRELSQVTPGLQRHPSGATLGAESSSFNHLGKLVNSSHPGSPAFSGHKTITSGRLPEEQLDSWDSASSASPLPPQRLNRQTCAPSTDRPRLETKSLSSSGPVFPMSPALTGDAPSGVVAHTGKLAAGAGICNSPAGPSIGFSGISASRQEQRSSLAGLLRVPQHQDVHGMKLGADFCNTYDGGGRPSKAQLTAAGPTPPWVSSRNNLLQRNMGRHLSAPADLSLLGFSGTRPGAAQGEPIAELSTQRPVGNNEDDEMMGRLTTDLPTLDHVEGHPSPSPHDMHHEGDSLQYTSGDSSAEPSPLATGLSRRSLQSSLTNKSVLHVGTSLMKPVVAGSRQAKATVEGWINEKKVQNEECNVISAMHKQQKKSDLSMFSRVIRSYFFDYFCGAVIVGNAAWIGYQTKARSDEPFAEDPGWWRGPDVGFTIWFSIELILRMIGLRSMFFFGSDQVWNFFDMFIVSVAVFEEAFYAISDAANPGQAGGDLAWGGSITILRVVRMLRLARIMRTIRVMRFFRELRLMIASIVSCLKSLLWACCVLLLFMWIFTVFFVQSTVDYIKEQCPAQAATNPGFPCIADTYEIADVKNLLLHYGSLETTMFELFQAVAGGRDWHDAASAIALAGPHCLLVYLFYIALTQFAVLNVVTGVFVEQATKTAMRDRDIMIQDEIAKEKSYVQDVRRVFDEADAAKTGSINREQFEEHLGDKRVKAFFGALEIEASEARGLFRLLDMDNSGTVDRDEFVRGCLRLKGNARGVDIATLMFENKRMYKKWRTFLVSFDEKLKEMLESENIVHQDLLDTLKDTYLMTAQIYSSAAGESLHSAATEEDNQSVNRTVAPEGIVSCVNIPDDNCQASGSASECRDEYDSL